MAVNMRSFPKSDRVADHSSCSMRRNAATGAPRRNCDHHHVRDTTISLRCHELIRAAELVQELSHKRLAFGVSDALSWPLHRIAAASLRWVRHAVLRPGDRFPSNPHGRRLLKKG
jgi:hypothetical protein